MLFSFGFIKVIKNISLTSRKINSFISNEDLAIKEFTLLYTSGIPALRAGFI